MVAMGAAANPHDDPADLAALAGHARALADAVEVAIPRWVHRCVERARGREVDDGLRGRTEAAARAAQRDGAPRVRALLDADVDDQRTGPLDVLRSLVRYPTEVLRAEGVAPVARDELARSGFPDDDYDLTPASFADIDPSLHELGLVWGAAKAHVVLARRRGEGRR
jgi:hypothetical protein